MFASILMPSLCGWEPDWTALDSTIDDPEPLSAQDEDPYVAHPSGSFVPSTTQGMTNCIAQPLYFGVFLC